MKDLADMKKEAGRLPPPDDGTAPVGADGKPLPELKPAAELVPGLFKQWEKRDPTTTTGLVQFDALLGGGMRPGNMLALAAPAKAGKSAFFGQVAYDAAKAGAVVVFASSEMSELEVLSRWVTLELFRQASDMGHDWALSYGDVLYGRAWRGELADAADVSGAIRQRLERATEAVQEVGRRLFVHRSKPGTTPNDLREIVQRARDTTKAGDDALAVLVVDPLQRLFASAQGALSGRVLEQVNATETSRVSAVAEELKNLADDDALKAAVLFTSDTTKDAVGQASSSSLSLRGSYQLNHWATTILGMHVADTTEGMWDRLFEAKYFKDTEKSRFEAFANFRVPEETLQRLDAARLGPKVAFVECSGNRAAADVNMAFGFVRGAMSFLEHKNVANTLKSPSYDGPSPSQPIRKRGK